MFLSDVFYQAFNASADSSSYANFLSTVSNSRQSATVKVYSRVVQKWKSWCLPKSFVSLPALPGQFAVFLFELSQLGHSVSHLEQHVSGVTWWHDLSGFYGDQNPIRHPIIRAVLEAKRRTNFGPKNRKEPFTQDIIHRMAKFVNDSEVSIRFLRLATMCIVGFSAFLRISELLNIHYADVNFFTDYFTLFLEKSKTDVYREGNLIFLAKTNSAICPFFWLTKYFEKTKTASNKKSDFIFRCLFKRSGGSKFCLGAKPLTYTRAREDLHLVLKKIGISPSEFGWHSLRSRGASCALKNNVPIRLVLKQGRWKCLTSLEKYVQDSKANRLLVSSLISNC